VERAPPFEEEVSCSPKKGAAFERGAEEECSKKERALSGVSPGGMESGEFIETREDKQERAPSVWTDLLMTSRPIFRAFFRPPSTIIWVVFSPA